MTPLTDATICRMRVPYQGANIRTWVGFKHLMYLAEGALLEWFRCRGIGPQELYQNHALELEVLDSSAQFPGLVEADDAIMATAIHKASGKFAVQLRADRVAGEAVVVNANFQVALIGTSSPATATDWPATLVAPSAAAASGGGEVFAIPPGGEAAAALQFRRPHALVWTWSARYFHCHFSDRVQHGTYIALLEEAVDRFVAARGISVGSILRRRGWIPVVSRARVRLIADAHMEEPIHTAFWLDETLKDLAYSACMECYVVRDGSLTQVAEGRVLHGYAAAGGDNAGKLMPLDAGMIEALTGASRL